MSDHDRPPPAPPHDIPQTPGGSGALGAAGAPESSSVRSAAVLAGVSSVALAGGIVGVILASDGTETAGRSLTPPLGGPFATTGSAGAPVTTSVGATGDPASSPGDDPTSRAPTPDEVSGEWTGTVDGGGTPVRTRLILQTPRGSAVTGQLMFGDPGTDSEGWAIAGALTGSLDDRALTLRTAPQDPPPAGSTDSPQPAVTDIALDLTIDRQAMTGTGTLPGMTEPLPITVTLARG